MICPLAGVVTTAFTFVSPGRVERLLTTGGCSGTQYATMLSLVSSGVRNCINSTRRHIGPRGPATHSGINALVAL